MVPVVEPYPVAPRRVSPVTCAAGLRSLEDDELWARRDAPDAQEVRAELARRYLPLARRLASRYRSHSESMDDLVQVACVGLLGAIDRFDPEHGNPFQSFAIPTILGELKRHFRDTGWAAHVPRRAQEMALRVDRATEQLTADTGRAPDIQTLADYLRTEVEEALLGLEARTAHYWGSVDVRR